MVAKRTSLGNKAASTTGKTKKNTAVTSHKVRASTTHKATSARGRNVKVTGTRTIAPKEPSASERAEDRYVSIRDLQNQTSAVLRSVDSGYSHIITNRGRPVAILAPIDANAFEDWALEQALAGLPWLSDADADLAAGETAELDDFLATLDA